MSVEAMRQALEALELALSSHGVMLLSDPPQDAWKTRQVENKGREAVTALRAAIEQHETIKIDFSGCYIRVGKVSEPIAVVRQWVGLTDREATDLIDQASYTGVTNCALLLILVEAKLKEKNT